MNEDKLVRYLINEGLVRVDDIPDEQAVGEAIIVMEGMQHKISALQAMVEACEKLLITAEEHRTRYANENAKDGNEYWKGRRDEAGFFRDKLVAILKGEK